MPAPIAIVTSTARGYIKGYPRPYVPGHKNGPNRRPLADRFWEKVDKTDGCWQWTGGLGTNGYGRIKRGGRYSKDDGAHRVSWEIHFGPIPDDLWVLHHCDNPSCVRPSHLFLGNARDNTADKVEKGRHARGESHGCSKLTGQDVISIRKLSAMGMPRSHLTLIFGVSKSAIDAVVTAKTWRSTH